MNVAKIQNITSKMWESISKIQDTLNLDDYEISQIMETSRRQFRSYRSRHASPMFPNIVNLTDHLKIPVESLISDTVDYGVLKEHYCNKNLLALKEKYKANITQIPKHSLTNLLEYISLNYQPAFKTRVMQNLQITQEAINHENTNFSLETLMDTIKLARPQIPQGCLKSIGHLNAKSYKSHTPKNDFASIKKMYADFLEILDESGQNWNTSMDICADNTIRIKVIPKEEIVEYYKSNKYSSPEICRITQGLIETIPLMYGMTMMQTDKTHCTHQGDDYCAYEINTKIKLGCFLH